MDYEEKYNAALERAKKLQETCDSTAVVGWCEYIFPELKESEDERIRKRLIKAFGSMVKEQWGGIAIDDILAWLEKQGECSWKPTEEQFEALDYARNSCSDTERGNYYEGVLADLIEDLHKLHE